MILRSLTLKNWRRYREPETFEFAPGINVLSGPNEAGKSTVFEAITRTLFARHSARSQEIQRVRPLGSTLGPQTELVVVADGGTYRIRKRFLVDAFSELATERDRKFELDHEGDRADEKIRELLNGSASRGVLRAQHRGLAHALWYLQNEDALPRTDWNEALREGLGGLVRVAIQHPLDDAVARRIQATYNDTFTPTGRLRKRSELALMTSEVASLAAELEGRRAELERAQEYRDELASLQRKDPETAAQIELLDREIADLERTIEERQQLEEARAGAERELDREREQERRLQQRLGAIERRGTRCEELRTLLDEALDQSERLTEEIRVHRRAAESHAQRWEGELRPQLERLGSEVQDLRSRLRVDQLERESELLTSLLLRHDQDSERLQALRGELTATPSPTHEELEELRAESRRLERLEGRLAARAVRLELTTSEPSEWTIDGESIEVPEDGASLELLVRGRASLRYDDHTELVVGSADGELENLALQVQELEASVSRRLAASGHSDVNAAVAAFETRSRLAAEVQQIEQRLDTARHDTDDARKRLRSVRQELDRLRELAPQALLPGMGGWALEQTEERLAELEEARRAHEKAIVAARDAEAASQQESFSKNEELVRLTEVVSGHRKELESLEEQNRSEARELGNVDALRRRLEEAKASVAQRLGELHSLAVAYREQVEEPRRLLVAKRRQRDELVAELARIRERQTDRLARIEEIASSSVDASVVDLENRLDAHQRRLETLERRAAGAAVLQRAVERLQTQRAEAISTAISERVSEWFASLTDQRYAGVSLDETLLPHEVTSTRYDQPLALESLSHGTYEQVVVLLRLAIAERLASDERQLVVLDDRFVNADEGRMAKLCEILTEVGQSCQILLATHRPEAFQSLVARRVEIHPEAVRSVGGRPEPSPDSSLDAAPRGVSQPLQNE